MNWAEYNKIPLEYKTAREIGLAAATLGAMVRRGLVETTASSPKLYRRINSPASRIYQLCEEYKQNQFILYKKDSKNGMLCTLSKNSIFDCYGTHYNLNGVNRIRFISQKNIINLEDEV
jgi:hypothetical protein